MAKAQAPEINLGRIPGKSRSEIVKEEKAERTVRQKSNEQQGWQPGQHHRESPQRGSRAVTDRK